MNRPSLVKKWLEKSYEKKGVFFNRNSHLLSSKPIILSKHRFSLEKNEKTCSIFDSCYIKFKNCQLFLCSTNDYKRDNGAHYDH